MVKSVSQPTGGFLVLCGYKVRSAFKYWGSATGAIMVRVERIVDIPDEFELRMMDMAKLDHRFFGIERPSSWSLTWFLTL